MTPVLFGKKLPAVDSVSELPDWQQADPAWIEASLRASQTLPSGGWYVVDASRAIGSSPRRYQILGTSFVVWRSDFEIVAGLDRCPHMGASLAEGRVEAGELVCPWHGLRLGPQGNEGWRPKPTFDDGVLVWMRAGLSAKGEEPTDRPILPDRPPRYFDGVIRVEARCEPEDVVANRLDPWHGSHYHAHSFGPLRVIAQEKDSITVRVVYRVVGPLGMEVDARFHCPDPRSIVMTIVAGEGVGSVVETHVTPIAPGRTAVIEATLATSERPQFWAAVRPMTRFFRGMVQSRARRLWVDDVAYAERRYALRNGESG